MYNVVLVSSLQQSDAYIYIYSFSNSFPIQVIEEYWAEFPVLYSRFLFIIYFNYNNSIYQSQTYLES